MIWRVKGVIQAALSVLPGGLRLNDLLQRTSGGLRNFEGNIETKVMNDWSVLVANMREIGCPIADVNYVEIGTGWYPTLPMCFFLAGAKSCSTYDIRCHLNSNLTFRMLRCLKNHLELISQCSGRPLSVVRAGYEVLAMSRDVSELLAKANIRYVAPGNATQTALPDNSIDVVFSNSVLEHVPRKAILDLMRESRRILRPGGIAVHSVNCGDHYAYVDPNITAVNYLTYTERAWKRWDNELLYQNRLRAIQFLELAELAGLKVILSKYAPKPSLLLALSEMKIAAEFSKFTLEQLACTSVDFIAQKP